MVLCRCQWFSDFVFVFDRHGLGTGLAHNQSENKAQTLMTETQAADRRLLPIAHCSASINLSGARVVSFFGWKFFQAHIWMVVCSLLMAKKLNELIHGCAVKNYAYFAHHLIATHLSFVRITECPFGRNVDFGHIEIKQSMQTIVAFDELVNILVFRTCLNLNNE